MDVRCEKCNTEYELDEARLKPGGVTVKCTNCGHMFKIRKRSPTNVGAAVETTRQAPRPVARNEGSTDEPTRTGRPAPRADEPAPPRPTAPAPAPAPRPGRPDSIVGEHPPPPGEPPAERQWLVRLENGEQKSCRELSSLQQWIVAGVVTRESMISRSGKTWKRLGDVAELGQYFVIADEARTKREAKDPGKVMPTKQMPATMLGIGTASAAGGSIVPDDDAPRTGNDATRPRTVPPPPPAAVTPPPPKRPPTQPPPPPTKKPTTIPAGNRSTAAWATEGGTPGELKDQSSGPAGPLGGRVKAASADPVFSGRVRVAPGDDSAFTSGKVQALDEDDDVLPERRGSRAGAWVALLLLLVGGAAAAAVYVFIIKDRAPRRPRPRCQPMRR